MPNELGIWVASGEQVRDAAGLYEEAYRLVAIVIQDRQDRKQDARSDRYGWILRHCFNDRKQRFGPAVVGEQQSANRPSGASANGIKAVNFNVFGMLFYIRSAAFVIFLPRMRIRQCVIPDRLKHVRRDRSFCKLRERHAN